jgi:MraZ protein
VGNCVILWKVSTNLVMTSLLGEYEVAMDAKGRFLMPSGFRKQLPEGAEMRFVVNRGLETCLTLYTLEGWGVLNEKLSKLNDFNTKVQRLKRVLMNGATIIELDSAGRMLLPKTLQEFAGLKKELIFSAQGNKVEIWDKDTYYDYMKQHSASLGDLADEVFGGDFIDPFQ